MMKNYVFFLVITLALVNCQQKKELTKSAKPTNDIVIGQIDSIYSNLLNESRNIWVHVPESATNNPVDSVKYPVLYLLDGPAHFHTVTGMIKQLSATNGNTLLPEMIIVAIPNTNRSRDLTPTHVDFDFFSGDSIQYASGGGDKFLDFMEEELIPHIERTYPAASYRTFVGHSFGGLSVINALISRQHLFHNYVAIDPSLWWDNQAFLNQADSILSSNSFDNKSLFVGVANTMRDGMTLTEVHNDSTKNTAHIRSILQFVNARDAQKDTGLLFDWKYYSDDDHGSVPLITEYDALRFLFEWYTISGLNQFYDPSSTTTADALIEVLTTHYKNISTNYGYEVLPPEQYINSLGYRFLNNSMTDKAAALFDLNIENYSKSSNVYDSRGDAFLAQQDSVKALEYFTKALEVGTNEFSQEKIDMLKENLKIE